MWTYKTVVVNGEDILLLGHKKPEAPTSRILERNAASLSSKDLIHIITVIQLVIKPVRYSDRLCWVTILDNDKVVRLKERPPHLQEIKVPYRWDDDVEFVFQRGRCWG